VATVVYRAAAIPHGYWLPLTVLVVLRADFTSTAVRGVSRILGTIGGAALATLLAALLRPDNVGLTVLFTVSVFVSYLVVRANYTLFSIAVTSYVVFLLAFAKLPELSAVTYRLTSTLLGGALAVIAYLLWPTWESRLVGPQLADLLEAQADYSGAVLGVFADPERGRPPPPRRAAVDRQESTLECRGFARPDDDRAAASNPLGPVQPPAGDECAGGGASFRPGSAHVALGSSQAGSRAVPEVTPLSRGIGGVTRGNAARLRILVPSSRLHPVAGVRCRVLPGSAAAGAKTRLGGWSECGGGARVRVRSRVRRDRRRWPRCRRSPVRRVRAGLRRGRGGSGWRRAAGCGQPRHGSG